LEKNYKDEKQKKNTEGKPRNDIYYMSKTLLTSLTIRHILNPKLLLILNT